MGMKDKDTEIFKGKTLSSLLNDIYNNQLHTKSQIDLLCDELSKMIKNVSDVAVISPIIKDYLDVACGINHLYPESLIRNIDGNKKKHCLDIHGESKKIKKIHYYNYL